MLILGLKGSKLISSRIHVDISHAFRPSEPRWKMRSRHGKQFHTNHYILFSQASSWCLCNSAFQKHVNSKVEKASCRFAFFAAVNHLSGPLRKQNFTLTGSKGYGLWFVIGEFRSVYCVSLFQGSLLVITKVIMIDGSKKRIYEGCFWT